jgi:hypothetical protein
VTGAVSLRRDVRYSAAGAPRRAELPAAGGDLDSLMKMTTDITRAEDRPAVPN